MIVEHAVKRLFYAIFPYIVITLTIAGACIFLTWFDSRWLWIDDFQIQYLPVMQEIGEALSSGEWPVLSIHSWYGGNIAGEYQYGLFSVFALAQNFLIWNIDANLNVKATFLVGVHLLILATGIYKLARQRKLSTEWALFAAISGALSSWLLYWGRSWFPALASFAWLPWVWWALESFDRGARKRVSRIFLAGLFIYLVISAGWPYTVIMIALLSALLALRAWRDTERQRSFGAIILAWLIGLGLSSPAILAFLEHYYIGTRHTLGAFGGEGSAWTVPFGALINLVTPFIYISWNHFLGKSSYHGIEMFTGLAPVALVITGLLVSARGLWRKLRWDFALLGIGLVLVCAPTIEPFRWPFRWLPIVHLVFALIAAGIGESLSVAQLKIGMAGYKDRFSAKQNPGVIALLMVLITFVYAMLAGINFNSNIMLELFLLTAIWVIVSAAISYRPGGYAIAAMLAFILFQVAVFSNATHNKIEILGGWKFNESIRDTGPLDRDTLYFSIYDFLGVYNPTMAVEGFGGIRRFGNTWTYAGLHGVNGYSPIGHAALNDLFGMRWAGFLERERILGMISNWGYYSRLLKLMGVDGLIVQPDYMSSLRKRLDKNEWNAISVTDEGYVFHRKQKSARVRSVQLSGLSIVTEEEFLDHGVKALNSSRRISTKTRQEVGQANVKIYGKADVTLISESRTRVVANLSSRKDGRPLLVVFSRLWFPGYEVLFNGDKLPLSLLEGILPSVVLPPDSSGELVLQYRPKGIRLGLAIAALTILSVLAAALFIAAKNSRHGR